MEEIFKEMMDKYQDIRRNGKILVDIQVPQVNSRIMNIKAEDGTIWYCRMMDGKVYDLVDMDTLEKMPRICEYRGGLADMKYLIFLLLVGLVSGKVK